MKRYVSYFRLQLKRAVRVAPYILSVMALTFAGVLIAAAILMENENLSEENQKVKVGIVGDTSEPYMEYGIKMLGKLCTAWLEFSTESMSEEEAKQKLLNGELSCYIVFPDGFAEALNNGSNMQAVYVTSAGAVTAVSLVKNELADMTSQIVTQSQSVIRALGHYMYANGMEDDWEKETDRFFMQLLQAILFRKSLYTTELLGALDGLSMVGYYICALNVLLAMLWGVAGSPLLTGKDVAVSKFLRAGGICAAGQTVCEYGAYLLLMIGNAAIVAAALLAGMSYKRWFPDEWESVGDGVAFFIRALPVFMMLAAMQYFFYELLPSAVNGILVQFFLIFGMGYLSGCFYPISFFPERIGRIAQFIPAGVAREYLKCSYLGQWDGKCIAWLAAYLAAFLLLAAAIRARRIRHEG